MEIPKEDSEHSYSGDGDTSTSSGNTSGISELDETLEPVTILGQNLEIPVELCEDFSVFKEFFSIKTWESLDEVHKNQLKNLLPSFKEDDEKEKEKTIGMLFNYEPFHFKSPLAVFYNNLHEGNYRPDIAQMKSFLRKAKVKQQRHQMKSYYSKLLPEVLLCRERLLAAAKASPPGVVFNSPLPPKPSSKNNYKPLYNRAKQRYFDELAAIHSEVGGDISDDENYPEGPPEFDNLPSKHPYSNKNGHDVSGTLSGLDPSHPTSLQCLKKALSHHRLRRQYRENHPELNTTGITLEDVKQRVALVNGTKRSMFGGKADAVPPKIRRVLKKDINKKCKTDSKHSSKKSKDIYGSVDNKSFKKKYKQHESDSDDSLFVDQSPRTKRSVGGVIKTEIKQEVPEIDKSIDDSSNHQDFMHNLPIKEEPIESSVQSNAKITQPVPIKLEDLDGIDMMTLPVELADESGSLAAGGAEDAALSETTHANFMCVVRALFPARAAHRATRRQLHARCRALITSPIAPLNTWYHLSKDWCAELDSALEFLAGERGRHPDDFVPYVQYISETETYQWIGAGRDCDAILGRLCERWLRCSSPAPPPPHLKEPSPSPPVPPPRCSTSWVVRAPTAAELADFRAQERRRYASAIKPFTYHHFGYSCVVGGIARAGAAVASSVAAGGALVASSRPRHATFAALVRDALARLPNGEGTRQHLLTMLKMSQWIVASNEQALLSAMSATLDRLLMSKKEPFVKYDQKTTTWIYLHRHRSEEDWLKSCVKRSGRAPLSVVLPPPRDAAHSATAVENAESSNANRNNDNASDSDVDVDDSGTPPSELSSAQMLMQAQSQPPDSSPPNQKLKLIQLTPNKQAKPTTLPTKAILLSQPKPVANAGQKQINVIPAASKQTPKQGTLMAQSIKQANAAAQLIKANLVKQVNAVQKLDAGNASPKPNAQTKQTALIKQIISSKELNVPMVVQVPKSSPAASTTVLKQRTLVEVSQPSVHPITTQSAVPATSTVLPTYTIPVHQVQNKMALDARSLLIRPKVEHTTPASVPSSISQSGGACRRGVIRVLSPASPAHGKSLISPKALLTTGAPTAKKRVSTTVSTSSLITTTAQSAVNTSPSSAAVSAPTSPATRVVQLGGGRALHAVHSLHAVHLPIHLQPQTVRLPNGQTVHLASPQSVKQPVKNAPAKINFKPAVQIAGQSVQISGQSLQLTGHTVKLPSGQSVQVAGQNVQLGSGQTVQLAGGNLPSIQVEGQNVRLSSQSVQGGQLGSHVGGQTVQLAAGHTVQLPSGQTLQLPSGQTIQLSSGQTLQLAGQTVQLASQQQKQLQAAKSQTSAEKTTQPIVAKLLTSAEMESRSALRVARPLLFTTAKPLHNIILQGEAGAARGSSAGAAPPASSASTSQTIVITSLGTQVATTTATTSAPLLKLHQVNTLQQVKLPAGFKIQQGVGGVRGVRGVVMEGQQLRLVGGRHVLARLVTPNTTAN